MADRRYWVGMVGGVLIGLALGIPGGYALQRDRGHASSALERPTPVRRPVPPKAAVANDPVAAEQVAALVDEGRREARSGQFERAVAAGLEAERLDPRNASIKNNLCAYLGELRRFDEATVACRAALALQPDFQLARNNLAWVQAEQTKANALTSSRMP